MVLDRRRDEASATDYSRMAWLALHIGQEQKAILYTEAGLQLDSDNDYCRRLAQQLGLSN